ncbi:MAG: hypothetical protein IJU86_00790 [Firmicutes bacterium]|nr:hypothetical protein [Bacillota bacterium]
MFDEIKDFVGKNKLWFIIGGIVVVIVGAVLAALISLYFLIVLAVGLIVAVLPGLIQEHQEYYTAIKNINAKIRECNKKLEIGKERIKNLNKQISALNKIKNLTEYKKQVKQIITADYIDKLGTDFYLSSDSFSITTSIGPGSQLYLKYCKSIKDQDLCSVLFDEFNDDEGYRGDTGTLLFIKIYFSYINLDTIISNYEIAIRGNIEALFEVLTGSKYEDVQPNKDNDLGIMPLLQFASWFKGGHGHHNVRKAYCEKVISHAINSLLNYSCQNQELPKSEGATFDFEARENNHEQDRVSEKPKAGISFNENPYI